MARCDDNDIVWTYGIKKKMKKLLLSLPIIVIILISSFSLIYLLQKKDPNKPPSALLNENLPEINLANLLNEQEILSNFDLKEKTILINFFASWCAPCKIEHPLFFDIKKKYPNLYLIGIDHKDKKEDALKYLSEEGNPYDYVGVDKKGSVGLEFGVFGLPETFLVNSSGIIIYKYLGPLTKKVFENEIKPLLK
jgi:cytochrome c biogenesis protein CcmG/thiol:disulfide interchange protein DsbE